MFLSVLNVLFQNACSWNFLQNKLSQYYIEYNNFKVLHALLEAYFKRLIKLTIVSSFQKFIIYLVISLEIFQVTLSLPSTVPDIWLFPSLNSSFFKYISLNGSTESKIGPKENYSMSLLDFQMQKFNKQNYVNLNEYMNKNGLNFKSILFYLHLNKPKTSTVPFQTPQDSNLLLYNSIFLLLFTEIHNSNQL